MSNTKQLTTSYNVSMNRHLLILTVIFIFAGITSAQSPLPQGLYDDAYFVLDYTGTWATVADPNALGSSVSQTTTAGDGVTFQTDATGFDVYFTFSNTGDSSITICVDATCSTINTNGAPAHGRAQFTSLPAGLKTVEISKSVADGSDFNFDGVYIHPAVAEEVPVTETVLSSEYTYAGEPYAGSIVLSMDAGQVAMLRLLVFIAVVSTLQLVVGMFKR